MATPPPVAEGQLHDGGAQRVHRVHAAWRAAIVEEKLEHVGLGHGDDGEKRKRKEKSRRKVKSIA